LLDLLANSLHVPGAWSWAITAAGDKDALAGGLATLPGDLRQLGGCVNILAQPGNREAPILPYPVPLDTVAAASVADAA
jgi:hypothetical protein